MSRNRFSEILRFLKFDDKQTRSFRLQSDKFALVSTVWNYFIENCYTCYKPGENITIDEQLFPFKARCPFTQFIPQKPDKYGQKYWLAVDVDARYVLNGFPYLGKSEERPANMTLGEYVVMKLVRPYLGMGRNVTTDNFFTSVKLAKELKKHSTSIVGTVNRAKREIPVAIKNSKDLLYTRRVYKHDDSVTLTVYQGKTKKNVLLLSTLHQSVNCSSNEKKTPDTVEFYNRTKFGVDVVDQMSRQLSTKAGCRRWPVHSFCNILDLAAINAHSLYKSVTGEKPSRKAFILKLAEELQAALLSEKNLSESDEEAEVDQSKGTKRKKCQVLNCKGNKTTDSCKKAVCGQCCAKIKKICTCVSCA